MHFAEQISAIESKMKPHLTVPVKMVPEAEDWKVGEEYEVTLKVTQKALRELETGDLEVTFEINEIEADGESDSAIRKRLEKLESEANNYETA